MAAWVALGCFAAFSHGYLIVLGIFDDRDAAGPEQVFFSLSGVGGHVNCDLESQLGRDDPYGEPQVSGGSHLN